jgi:hypothetical protein
LGEDTGVSWRGVVLEYLGQKDERFEYNKRLNVNRFVFAMVDGDTLLNSWHLEDAWPAQD